MPLCGTRGGGARTSQAKRHSESGGRPKDDERGNEGLGDKSEERVASEERSKRCCSLLCRTVGGSRWSVSAAPKAVEGHESGGGEMRAAGCARCERGRSDSGRSNKGTNEQGVQQWPQRYVSSVRQKVAGRGEVPPLSLDLEARPCGPHLFLLATISLPTTT